MHPISWINHTVGSPFVGNVKHRFVYTLSKLKTVHQVKIADDEYHIFSLPCRGGAPGPEELFSSLSAKKYPSGQFFDLNLLVHLS